MMEVMELAARTIIRGNPVTDGVLCLHAYTPWSVYSEEGRTEDATVHDRDVMNMKARENGSGRQETSIERIAKELADAIEGPADVVVVPPSNPKTPRSGLHGVARELGKLDRIEDASTIIVRIAPKDAAHEGGDRSLGANLTTLSISDAARVQGRRILLLDDMSKTGNTMAAARQLLIEAGARQVEAVAIGCTKGATRRE